MNEKLLKIISFYGVMPQLKYFQSEVFELNEAIIDYENWMLFTEGKITPTEATLGLGHITEEIADVMVMLNQFMHYYGIKGDEIMKIMEQKINRQLERIENENNN